MCNELGHPIARDSIANTVEEQGDDSFGVRELVSTLKLFLDDGKRPNNLYNVYLESAIEVFDTCALLLTGKLPQVDKLPSVPCRIGLGNQYLFLNRSKTVFLVTPSSNCEEIAQLPLPKQIAQFSNIVEVSCGSHCLMLDDEGNVFSFGDTNKYGQLGREGDLATHKPRQIEVHGIQSICCGFEHSTLVTRDGFLITFGRNDDGQLGNGNLTSTWQPCKVPDIEVVRTVKCGRAHTLVHCNDGAVYFFGNNMEGQSSYPTLDGYRIVNPTRIVPDSNIMEIACGAMLSCFLLDDGTVFRTSKLSSRHTLTRVKEIPHILQISCCNNLILALDVKGFVWIIDESSEPQKLESCPMLMLPSGIAEFGFLRDFKGTLWAFNTNSSFPDLRMLPEQYHSRIASPKSAKK